jgi:outer membrane protein OmpA-like peptidoglycan-associated protein
VRTFERARNAEIEASLAAVNAERERAFERARNAEIEASIAAVNAERARQFARDRNAEIEASLAAVKAERERTFAAARNAEIDASIAAYEAQRRSTSLETGAIAIPETPTRPSAETSRQTLSAVPCRALGQPLDPVQFPGAGTDVDESMKPMLDRIAMIARTCPAVRIEIHGYTDASGPVQVRRRLSERRAQAALDYLVGAGVEASRIVAIGHGATAPRASNTTEQNRARNRRIEFTVRDPALEAAAARVMWDLAELLDPTYVPPLARLSP